MGIMKQNHTKHVYLSFFDPLTMKAKSKFESPVVRTRVDAKQVRSIPAKQP